LRKRVIARNPWLRDLADADIALAVSGGDSFSDIYGLSRFIYMSLPQLLVLALGRPLVLLPQTIGPMRSWLARRIARHVIDNAQVSFTPRRRWRRDDR
jgi:polysaccharide pyruvyl transferase WcaK-like protein